MPFKALAAVRYRRGSQQANTRQTSHLTDLQSQHLHPCWKGTHDFVRSFHRNHLERNNDFSLHEYTTQTTNWTPCTHTHTHTHLHIYLVFVCLWYSYNHSHNHWNQGEVTFSIFRGIVQIKWNITKCDQLSPKNVSQRANQRAQQRG